MSTISTPNPAISFTPPLLTQEEFLERYRDARMELINGIVKEMPVPNAQHGYIIPQLTFFLLLFVREHKLGRVVGNDSSITIRRHPDSVYGPDLYYISFTRLPHGRIPVEPLAVAPELVVEVRSPTEAWTELFAKVHDYLALGVQAVLVVNIEKQAIAIYRAGMQEEHLSRTDDLTIPDVLPGFRVPLRDLFEEIGNQ